VPGQVEVRQDGGVADAEHAARAFDESTGVTRITPAAPGRVRPSIRAPGSMRPYNWPSRSSYSGALAREHLDAQAFASASTTARLNRRGARRA
jgi:hypothetical protein